MNQTRFLISVALALFAGQCAWLIDSPLLVDIASEFDVSVAIAGQLATASFAAWAVSVVISGPLSDSFGRRPVALLGLSLLCAGAVASSFAPNLGILLATRTVTGLGGGMIPPNSMAAVADVVSSKQRAVAVGRLMAFNTLASVIGIPILALVAELGGWRLPFLALGLILAAVGTLNWFWFPMNENTGPRSFSLVSRYRELLSISMFRAAFAVNMTQRMAFFALSAYLAAYLIDLYGVNLALVAILLAVVGVGRVAGSYMAGVVGNRSDRMTIISVSSVGGGALALFLFSVALPMWVVVALATVSVGLLSIGWPVFMTFSTEISGRSRATGVGLLGAGNQIGGVCGAAFGGMLLALTGFSGIGYLCVGTVLISAVITNLYLRETGASAKLSADGSSQTPHS
ncbi:MAG: MFS transporter [Chloroflexota bacterium]|nr:MFS transporter [Chloroflexota bacterium]